MSYKLTNTTSAEFHFSVIIICLVLEQRKPSDHSAFEKLRNCWQCLHFTGAKL